jgi:hypothetical protein
VRTVVKGEFANGPCVGDVEEAKQQSENTLERPRMIRGADEVVNSENGTNCGDTQLFARLKTADINGSIV